METVKILIVLIGLLTPVQDRPTEREIRVIADRLTEFKITLPPRARQTTLLWQSLPDSTVLLQTDIRPHRGVYIQEVYLTGGEYLRTVSYVNERGRKIQVRTKVIALPRTIGDKFDNQ